MFEISQKYDLYPTYVLSDDSAKAIAEIVPERGGIVTRWQVRGREILYLDRDRFAQPQLSVRGGIPILFPICGNLPGNTYIDNDRSYTLKQHGFAREMPWRVVEQSTTGQASVTLVLESNEQTLEIYPYEFQLAFTYTVQGNTLSISQRYTNQSDRPMPFSTGLHPYFCVSDKSQLQFDVPANEFLDQMDGTSHPFDGSFDFDRQEIDVAFRHLSRQTATVKDATTGGVLTLEYNSIYSTLVFWTVRGQDYYCLEPWSAPRNALNSGDRLIHLHPYSSLTTLVCLRVR